MTLTLTQALQNFTGTAPVRNDNETIKQQSSKESMEACQDVSKITSNPAKISHPVESRPVKPGVVINNSDKRSIDSRPISCRENVLLQTAESSVVTDQNGHVAGQGRGSKLNDLEDRAIAVELDLKTDSQQDRSRMTERIKPRVNDTSTTFTPDEEAFRSKIRNGRMPTEGRSFWKKHVSTPKYASFLRMFRKEETDNQLRNNSSSRRNEKLQRRGKISTERYLKIKYNIAERKKELKKFRGLKRLFLEAFLFDWT